LKQIRKRLTYANVMSSLAVFLILGGATAFAAVQKIGANEIKANSIKTGKIVKEAVTAGKLKNGAVIESKIGDGAVTTNKLADNAVTTGKIANDAVTGDKVKESSLGEVPLAANANKLGGQLPSAFQSRIRWALVAADGSIIRQSGGITSTGAGGLYELNFGANVANSAILADEIDNGSTGGTTAVMSCADSGQTGFGSCGVGANPDVVKVATTDAAAVGVSAQAFYLTVIG
jgi:hypothetical protein